jgi:uncharacterized membrane protein YraQ (UPF0718 family)
VLLPAWWWAYTHLTAFADTLLGWTGLSRQTALGESLHFFFYDTPKVLLLLTGVVFVMGMVQTWFAPERTRALLAGRRAGVGNVLAALLGIVTPSAPARPCRCSSASAGVPLGVTFSFLISAPMVNEVALVMLLGLFGWKVAALYLGLGLSVAIVAGWVIGRLGMERHLEDWVQAVASGQGGATVAGEPLSMLQRLQAGASHVREIVGKVWPYMVAGIALGAGIHGYVPQDFMAAIMGRCLVERARGGAAGRAHVHQCGRRHPHRAGPAGKGAALGTVLAFMMSVIALSAPEMIILRKALKPRLIATFAGVVAGGILLVGYVFNAVL